MRALVFCFLMLTVITVILTLAWLTISVLSPEKGQKIKVDCVAWEENRIFKFIRKYIIPLFFYLFGLAVIVLNIYLIFDNVLWGDEAFSAITVRADMKGILEIVHYIDSHPPFYYLWLRVWVVLLGRHGWVLHFASIIPFMAGIVVSMTLIRKRFGKLPATFLIILSGLSTPCVRYNVEIRMYALAFFTVLMAFYFASRIMDGKNYAWVGIVLSSLVGAYTHYYALVICGIMIVFTGIFYAIRMRGKGWFKGLIALAGYIIGYIPWMKELFGQTSSVSDSWWNTDILPVKDALEMVGAGSSFKICVLTLMSVFALLLIVMESGFLHIERKDKLCVRIVKPKIKEWTTETYGCIIGWLTIAGTIISAYVMCILINPILSQRYLYMLISVSALCLTMGACGLRRCIAEINKKAEFKGIYTLLNLILIFILCMMVGIGIMDYRVYRAEYHYEKATTEEFLAIVGEPSEDVVFVSNGVKHLAWTVLKYYYPNNEIMSGTIWTSQADHIFYFDNYYLTPEVVKELEGCGYQVTEYGIKRISQYPFVLYAFDRVQASTEENGAGTE